ncbi:MAG: hypothetical protein H6965_11065 [Chromatiaceae bacterium]|nr:hypothetical protein [Chromatiaceae bacterium]
MGRRLLSSASAAVANVNDAGSVTIDDSTPAQGQTLTASVSDPDGASGAISYQWLRDGNPISGATSHSYTPTQDDVGKTISVSATYTDDLGSGETPLSSATAAVANVNDAGSVTIDDSTPAQGQTLTASVSDIDGASGVISYQWLRDGNPIGGATGSSYTTVQADVGSTISVSATYTDDLGSGETPLSSDTAAVANVNDTGSVTIDDSTPAQGQTLTASVSDIDGASGVISYQWLRDGNPIGGATASSYTPTQDDVGRTISVSASYTDDLGSGETPLSSASAAVANVNDTGSVTIDDSTPAQGQTLTASVSDIDGASGVISYQWLRDGNPIGGATASSYTPTQADVGSTISVSATYTDDLGSGETPLSSATAAVANVNDTGSVTIDDSTPAQGQTLTASVSDPDGASGAISYQWLRDGNPIGGATSSSYTTVQADVGSTISVSASYTDDLGSGETPVSSASAAVANVNDAGSLAIDDSTPAQGQTLTASVSDIDGASGVISYQWLRDGNPIGGATSSSYTPTQADVGSTISVSASYTDDLGSGETPLSSDTAAVANVNDTGSVTIDDSTPAQGQTLTASVSDIDGPAE